MVVSCYYYFITLEILETAIQKTQLFRRPIGLSTREEYFLAILRFSREPFS